MYAVREGSVRFNLMEEVSPPSLFLSCCTYSMTANYSAGYSALTLYTLSGRIIIIFYFTAFVSGRTLDLKRLTIRPENRRASSSLSRQSRSKVQTGFIHIKKVFISQKDHLIKGAVSRDISVLLSFPLLGPGFTGIK